MKEQPSRSPRLRILFVCGCNLRRSPTAAALYRLDARSAGVSESARGRVGADDLAWADVVMVMERKYQQRLQAAFPGSSQLVFWNLEIPDDYDYMEAELQNLLRDGVETWLMENPSSISAIN